MLLLFQGHIYFLDMLLHIILVSFHIYQYAYVLYIRFLRYIFFDEVKHTPQLADLMPY